MQTGADKRRQQNEAIRRRLLRGLGARTLNPQEQLHGALHLLAKQRTLLLHEQLACHLGETIREGVFEGMRYPSLTSRTAGPARLLGVYEQPISRWIDEAAETAYQEVACFGCDDGYYPCGLAGRMPRATLRAYFRSERTRAAASALWADNEVGERTLAADRPTRSVWLEPPRGGGRRLIFIDSYEAVDEMAAELAAAARHADIIFEEAEPDGTKAGEAIRAAVANTHEVERIEDSGRREPNDGSWRTTLGELDRLLALWEWRVGSATWTRARRRRPAAASANGASASPAAAR